MSRVTVEDFDDDTDLPLPNVTPLRNTGHRGPLIERVGPSSDDDDDDEDDDNDPAPQLTQPRAGPASFQRTVTRQEVDLTPYKKWPIIYPLYIDAKAAFSHSGRRIRRTDALWWPLSKDIHEAAMRLGLGVLHEVHKCHPANWENPGRVRVGWKKGDKGWNNKKALLTQISRQIQQMKPDLTPRPPWTYAIPIVASTPPPPPNSKTKAITGSKPQSEQKTNRKYALTKRYPAAPPEPLPPLETSLSAFSPALPSGMLVDAVKASADAIAGGANQPGGAGKGKRKVVRVRG